MRKNEWIIRVGFPVNQYHINYPISALPSIFSKSKAPLIPNDTVHNLKIINIIRHSRRSHP